MTDIAILIIITIAIIAAMARRRRECKMKKTKTTMIGINIGAAEKSYYQKAAGCRGMTLTTLITQAVKFYLAFHDDFWKSVREFSERMGISETVVIQNIVLDYIAKKRAQEKVWGLLPREIPEFQLTFQGVKTGEALMEVLVARYVSDYQKMRERDLIDQEREGTILSDEEEAFLLTRHAGKLFWESREGKAELRQNIKRLREQAEQFRVIAEAKATGDIPPDLKPTPSLAEAIVQWRAGKMSKKDFQKHLELQREVES